jgi:trk system potassium uptake protein TrkH
MEISVRWRNLLFWRAQWSKKRLSPTRIVSLSFVIAILIGGFVLSLPISHAEGRQIQPLDALFMAASALCVTGLAVVDTGSDFSRFGQVVILLLIQIGGFGVITLGTLVAFLSGRRIGFRERMNLQAQINSLHVGGVVKLIRRIIVLIITLEAAGTLLLFPVFAAREGMRQGFFYALFHSVSAFNNAGFGLYADNLVSYVDHPLVNFTIMALIVLGGLGFIVIMDVLSHLRSRDGRKPLLLHTKMALTATAFLIVAGAGVILLFEWSNPQTLGPLDLSTKLLASLFQSVTARTAGFNTLNYGLMMEGTLIFTMLLMFIGGSPGSTAGGIKTVTFFVLVGSAWSISRGYGELVIFGRRVTLETVAKAGSIALISMLVVGALATLLVFTDVDFSALHLGFEAVSAFGTAGLSTGITPQLSPWSKLILMTLMYFGRLGPLTLALALVEKAPEKRIAYPAEDVVIG